MDATNVSHKTLKVWRVIYKHHRSTNFTQFAGIPSLKPSHSIQISPNVLPVTNFRCIFRPVSMALNIFG